MRTNGTLRYQLVTEGGFNEYGESLPAATAWSDPLPCHIKTNSDTRKGRYEDGLFRQASFTVLLELVALDCKRVSLERHGEQLGEYDVISIEPLAVVGRTQIVV